MPSQFGVSQNGVMPNKNPVLAMIVCYDFSYFCDLTQLSFRLDLHACWENMHKIDKWYYKCKQPQCLCTSVGSWTPKRKSPIILTDETNQKRSNKKPINMRCESRKTQNSTVGMPELGTIKTLITLSYPRHFYLYKHHL